MSIIKTFLLKLFSPFGYQGVINTQISIYNRLKRRAPDMPENELLNYLINSRIRSIPRVASKEEEYAHYTPLFENPNKTLEDVMWAIVEYEYILSREEYVFDQLSKIGYSPTQILARISDERVEIRTYIEESIEKKVKKRNLKVYKGRKEMGTKEQYKKIWYDILGKSKEIPKDIAEKFFIADNIDPLKFKENHDYYVMDRYGAHKPTSSCFRLLDLPLGYPYWFASAYPDVVKYFSTIEEGEFTRLFEDMGFRKEDLKDYQNNPKLFEQEEHCFTTEILYTFKEHYKELHPNAKLECQ